ncbi:hypothetical protein L1887_30437 [Cichorium endivia]|nr:hypothetical protein L1887_30437 [Cichorium endivia]
MYYATLLIASQESSKQVKPSGDVELRGDDEIFGLDTGEGIKVGGNNICASEFLQMAIFLLLQSLNIVYTYGLA